MTAASLRSKILLVVLATTGLALLFSATALLIYELRAYQQSAIDELQAQAEIIARASAPALSFDDAKSATEYLALLKVRPAITAGAVYRANGALFASYLPDDDGGVLAPRLASLEDSVSIEGERIEVHHAVRERDELLGSVVLQARYELERRLRDYLAILLGVMLTSLLVAALVTARVQHGITAPIFAVAEVARQVMQRRDFRLRAPRTSTAEVDVLVDAINDMLHELGQRSTALEHSNQQLNVEMQQRRHAEDALLQAARTKDEFLATLAHELRNPLAPMSNALHLLSRGDAGPGAMRAEALAIMGRQLQQMVRLIDDLLDVSRITTGKLTVQREPVDLVQVLRNSLEIAAPDIQARGHAVTVDLPASPVPLEADATRLAQVFGNLLNNAARYTPPHGSITLRLSTDQQGARVEVVDNGIGIDPAMAPRVFDMFVQADQSLERGKAGLGVGLTLARRLVELHGGRIEVDSAGLGHGTRFLVQLPLAPSDPRAARASSAGRPADAGPRRRILVADDNVDFATSLARILESLGHEVTVVHDGLAALASAAALRPEVAFLDIGMPGMNGYDLARRLRTVATTRAATLIALTGWGQPRDRELAREAGFDRHLVKPVSVEALRAALEAKAEAAR